MSVRGISGTVAEPQTRSCRPRPRRPAHRRPERRPRNLSTSSGVGGSPVKANETRRRIVARSAGGDATRCSFSKRAGTERVERRQCTCRLGERWQRGLVDRQQRPMAFEFRRLRDPRFERCGFCRAQPYALIRRRHPLIRVGRRNPPPAARSSPAAPRSPQDRLSGLLQPCRADAQSQIGLTLFGVWPMTLETMIGQDRPHIAVELDFLCCCHGDRQYCKQSERERVNKRWSMHPVSAVK